MLTSHTFSTVSELGQATPMLFIAIPIFVIVILRRAFYELLQDWGYTISANQINVDENLPNFF